MGRYFTIQEMCKSNTAAVRGIDNTPSASVVRNLHLLINNLLDPLREAWCKPIIVNSGYRCPALNKAVGGVATSQHMTGQAADLTTGNTVDNRKLFQLVQDLKLPFCQLINESDFSWVHISYDPGNIKRQVLSL